jgi:hypothetical protein
MSWRRPAQHPCSLGSTLSTTRCVRLTFCCSHAQSSSSSSAAAAAAPVVLIGVWCTVSPGVKAAALDRSIVEAWVAPCALLVMLRLAEATGPFGAARGRCRLGGWPAAPGRPLPLSPRYVAHPEGCREASVSAEYTLLVKQQQLPEQVVLQRYGMESSWRSLNGGSVEVVLSYPLY